MQINLSKLDQIFYRLIFFSLLIFNYVIAKAEENPASEQESSQISFSAPRSANQESANSITTIISAFRYDPQIDLQSINYPEAQSDIKIRGGNFDMSGINIGAATVYDPQTSHYTADLPIPPAFLSSASILTGADNALASFNASVGSIYSGFSPAENWNTTKVGIGEHGTSVVEVNTDSEKILQGDFGALAIATNLSYSSTNGSYANSDNQLSRYATRIQLNNSDLNQSDLIYSYQSKNYNWLNPYRPQNIQDSNYSDQASSNVLDTALLLLNHRTKTSSTGNIEVTTYYKRNHDNLSFDNEVTKSQRHTTKVFGGGIQGLEYIGKTYIGLNGQVYGDSIYSEDLNFGNYNSRTLAKLSSYVGQKTPLNDYLTLDPMVGASWDKSDRTSDHISPIAKISISERGKTSEHNIYAEYSGASQLAGYSMLNSNPQDNNYQDNSKLKREKSTNSEIGYRYQQEKLLLNTAIFYRVDNDASDWRYSRRGSMHSVARADNLNFSTRGAEIYGAITEEKTTLSASYSFLDKSSSSKEDTINSNFYNSSYPKHRVTNSIITKISNEFEIRGDIEFRKEDMNSPMASNSTSSLISSLSANYEYPEIIGLNLGLIVDNIGNEHLEEVPGIMPMGRVGSFIINYVW